MSDELFRAYRSLYSYDKTPLNATVEPFGTGRRRLEGGEDHVHGCLWTRAGGCLSISSQEGQAALPDGRLLSGIECSSAANVLGLPDGGIGCHSQERPRRALSRVQEHV